MKRLLLLVIALMAPAAAHAQDKARVGVFSFEFGTVKSESDAAFGTSVDVGKGMAELIVNALVRSGKVDVYERERLETIIKEQDITNSSRFDPKAAAAIGRNVGVQAVVIGSITRLGQQEIGFGVKRSEAALAITGRVIDTSTGQILFTFNGDGREKQFGFSIADFKQLINLPGAVKWGTQAADWLAPTFTESLMGRAMVAAAAKGTLDIVNQLAARPVALSGLLK